MAVPYTFGAATAAIPLSNLDSNFATTITLGNTAIQLGNTVTTLNNMTLANVTVSSGSVTLTNVSATLANVTTANIGTAVITGTSTLTGLTASTALALDASKNIASVTNTGTGNNVLATSPTITTPTISSLTSAAATALTLQTAGTTAVTVDTSRNVGIGTTSPSGRLHVTATAGSQTDAYFGNQTAGATTNLRIQSASSNDGYVFFERSGASENGYIRYSQASDFMAFQTASAERMRINSSGNVLVGTTSLSAGRLNVLAAAGASGIVVQVTNNGDYGLAFNNASGTNVGRIQIDSGSTSYVTSSDYRLKNSIAPMTGALAKVALLKPCTYKWNADNSDAEGFIAHELAEVCPQAVSGEKDAVDADGNIISQGIDTSFLVATLTAAIQELTAKVTALENK